MSKRPPQPYAQVSIVANALVEALQPHCHRVEIAGSVRRQVPLCSDVEICAIPILHTNLIGDPMDTSQVDDLLATWPVTLHKNGHKYKAFSFEWQPGLPFYVDLFLPSPECWPVIYMIRTGSSEFSKKMVTAKSQGGYRPDHLRVQDGRVWDNGRAVDLESEAELFHLWNMDYVEPRERS